MKVIAYASRVFQPAEISYCTTRKELCGVIFGLKQFRHFLLARSFTLRTDHAALTSLMKSAEPVGQQARWLDLLAEFDFKIVHRPGTQQQNADALSRRPCGSRRCTREDCWEIKCDGISCEEKSEIMQLTSKTSNITIHEPSLWVEQKLMESLKLPDSCNNLSNESKLQLNTETMKNEQDKDHNLAIIKKLINENTDPDADVSEYGMTVVKLWSQAASYVIQKGVLYRKFERSDGISTFLQALTPKSLRLEMLKWCHDDLASGHQGTQRTQAKVQENAYWPGWAEDVENYVRRCELCCKRRTGPKYKQGPLRNVPALEVWSRVHIDLTGEHIKSSKGHKYLLTVICAFSKYLVICPLRDKTAKSVAKALVKHVILIFGACEFICHDLGKEFVNEIMQHIEDLTGIQDLKTSSFRPSGNSQIERVHGTINDIFAKLVNTNMRDWDEVAPYVCFAYNTARHSSTLFDPFFCNLAEKLVWGSIFY